MMRWMAAASLLWVSIFSVEAFTVYPNSGSVRANRHTQVLDIKLSPFLSMSSKSEETSKATNEDSTNGGVLKEFLEKEYSAFATFISLNPGLWQTLSKESAVTIFALPNHVFDKLGEKRLLQLRDIRNEETAQKIGLYHVVIGDAISSARMRTEDWTVKVPKDSTRPIKVSGLVTMGGEVPVGRPKTDGPFFARLLGKRPPQDTAGKKNDVRIGPNGRIQKSYKLADGACFVHEMDNFISPDILWRYCDQLRIPGF